MKSSRLVAVLLLWLAIRVDAGEPGTMHDRGLLPDTRYKIAILEFSNPKGKWGLELSQILTRELLGSIRGVNSFGVLNLRQDDRHVELSSATATEIARNQNALASLWGEFFESGNKVYLHSHLQIVPENELANVSLALALTTPEGVIRATPTSLLINFAPIPLDASSLRAIRESERQTSTIRTEPNENARVVANLRTEDAFGVETVEGPWMRIRTAHHVAGWVNYATLERQTHLRDLEGLLSFAQGTLQYLAGNFVAADETFSAYLNGFGEAQDKANLALAHIIRGNARYAGSSPERAAEEYLKAAELLPNAVAPTNYLALARLRQFQDAKGDVPEMHDLEARLIRAVQAQNDSATLENLRVFYRCAARARFLQGPETNSEQYASRIASQLQLVDQVATELKR